MSCHAAREAQLLAQGWVRQFLADEPRLGEAVAQYRELGFEVRLEPLDPAACAASNGCAACFGSPELAARFRVIFTRRPRPTA
jgi:hypothetical protein